MILDEAEPRHIEKHYGNVGRHTVQEFAMTDALKELIRVLESP